MIDRCTRLKWQQVYICSCARYKLNCVPMCTHVCSYMKSIQQFRFLYIITRLEVMIYRLENFAHKHGETILNIHHVEVSRLNIVLGSLICCLIGTISVALRFIIRRSMEWVRQNSGLKCNLLLDFLSFVFFDKGLQVWFFIYIIHSAKDIHLWINTSKKHARNEFWF
jgi:hypothetical protein